MMTSKVFSSMTLYPYALELKSSGRRMPPPWSPRGVRGDKKELLREVEARGLVFSST